MPPTVCAAYLAARRECTGSACPMVSIHTPRWRSACPQASHATPARSRGAHHKSCKRAPPLPALQLASHAPSATCPSRRKKASPEALPAAGWRSRVPPPARAQPRPRDAASSTIPRPPPRPPSHRPAIRSLPSNSTRHAPCSPHPQLTNRGNCDTHDNVTHTDTTPLLAPLATLATPRGRTGCRRALRLLQLLRHGRPAAHTTRTRTQREGRESARSQVTRRGTPPARHTPS